MGLNEAETFEWMRQRIADLERKLAAARWQPIESAPKDGTPILIFVDCSGGNRIHRVIRSDVPWGSNGIFGWAVEDRKFGPYALRGFMDARFWMPLPEPPAAALTEAGEQEQE